MWNGGQLTYCMEVFRSVLGHMLIRPSGFATARKTTHHDNSTITFFLWLDRAGNALLRGN